MTDSTPRIPSVRCPRCGYFQAPVSNDPSVPTLCIACKRWRSRVTPAYTYRFPGEDTPTVRPPAPEVTR